MVRTYNWNPSTQTNVKLGDNCYENTNDKYEPTSKNASSSNGRKNSNDLIDGKLSKINTYNYNSQNDSLYPPLKTTTTLSCNPSFIGIQDKDNYLPSTIPSHLTILNDKEKISFQNPLDISWNVPPEILEGRTFIVGMKAYSINGSILYKPLSVKNAFSSLITEHEQSKQLSVENSTFNINNQRIGYNSNNKVGEGNSTKLFDMERINGKSYYENRFLSPYTNEEVNRTIDYANDQKLPTLGNGRFINTCLNEENFLTRNNKTFVPGFNEKERHKHELLQQIEENKRRKEIEKYKEWEIEEKRRIRDEIYFEKQKQMMKEEEIQARLKMEMVQKKAEVIAARASEITKNHINVKKKHQQNDRNFNSEKGNDRFMSENNISDINLPLSMDDNNKKLNDGFNSEDKLSLKSMTPHSIRSVSSSSPQKRLEWWEIKKSNQTNVRSTTTSPPIPVLRNKMKDERNLERTNVSTNFEQTNGDDKTTTTFENEANNEKLEKREHSVSSTKSKNLSATAESLQRQLRLTNHQQIFT